MTDKLPEVGSLEWCGAVWKHITALHELSWWKVRAEQDKARALRKMIYGSSFGMGYMFDFKNECTTKRIYGIPKVRT